MQLGLNDCDVTDEGLRKLNDIPTLKVLGIVRTKCTPEAVAELRRARPDLRVQLVTGPGTQASAAVRTSRRRAATSCSSPGWSMNTEIRKPSVPVPWTRPVAIEGLPSNNACFSCAAVIFRRCSSQR